MDPKLALKGSSKVVTDYFEYAIHNILFQRGIYPAEDFQTVRKYGLPLLVNIDDDVRDYIGKIVAQLKKWVYGKKIAKLVLVIVSKSTFEPVERWEFDISIEEREGELKTRDATQNEIKTIIRQITSSVSYLPILKEDEYTFNIMVHTDHSNSNVPVDWCDGEDTGVEGAEKVEFAKFSTNMHKVGTRVEYKIEH